MELSSCRSRGRGRGYVRGSLHNQGNKVWRSSHDRPVRQWYKVTLINAAARYNKEEIMSSVVQACSVSIVPIYLDKVVSRLSI